MYTEQIARVFMGYVGRIPYAILSQAFLVAVPVLLLLILIVMSRAEARPRQGLLLGVGVAAYASICWLTVPYLGAYPCLPALLVKALFFKGGRFETIAEELVIHIANFVMWPVLGWSIMRVQRAIVNHRHQSPRGNTRRMAASSSSKN
jgi:hypothetical protein